MTLGSVSVDNFSRLRDIAFVVQHSVGLSEGREREKERKREKERGREKED